MTLAGHTAHMEKQENLMGRDHLGEKGADGRIILK
jgi:hypothetical protein